MGHSLGDGPSPQGDGGRATAEAETAQRCFDELERMRLWNAAWWATEGVQFYKPLLRWHLAALQEVPPGPVKQELYRRAATCYYRLGLYEKWEAGQTLLGKTPARQIEKSLKWDGITPSCQGKGNEIITQYLERKAALGGQRSGPDCLLSRQSGQ